MSIRNYIKIPIFFLSLLPILIIFYQIIFNQLCPEPVKEITHVTGNWTLRFIIITLAMTPLQKLTKFIFTIAFALLKPYFHGRKILNGAPF